MEQVAAAMKGFMSLLGRVCLAAVFVASLVGNKIPQFQQTTELMQSEGVPNPKLALAGAIFLLSLGGVSVILGAWTRIGAFCLLVFLCAATWYFHDFWRFADPMQRQLQTIQFLKNLAIAGGLLALLAFGGGPWSVDGWIGRKRLEVESGGGSTAAKPRVPPKPTTQAA